MGIDKINYKMDNIKTKLISVNLLKPNPDNPRVIKDEKFTQLVESIKSAPWMLQLRPIVVNSDMTVLGGNMRLKACIAAGMGQVPVIQAADLTQEQQREFVIKDNVGFGDFDWPVIQDQWPEAAVWGLDIPEFALVKPEAEEDDYDVPEGGIETDIVLGDLFEIGEHRLLCGDSTCSDTVAKLMDGQKADMVFTDPPYGISVVKNEKVGADFGIAKKRQILRSNCGRHNRNGKRFLSNLHIIGHG